MSTARFLHDHELHRVTKTFDGRSSGIVVHKNGEKRVIDSEYHSLLIGSTGSGKTRRVILQLIERCIEAGESVVVLDPKGDICNYFSDLLRRKQFKKNVLNFRDTSRSDGFSYLGQANWEYHYGSRDRGINMVMTLSNIIIPHVTSQPDPFWDNSSRFLFVALTLALFEMKDPKLLSFRAIHHLANEGMKPYQGNFALMKYLSSFDESTFIENIAGQTLQAPKETRNSILSVFNTNLSLFSISNSISNITYRSDFSFDDIGSGRTATFIIVPDENDTYYPLATAFITLCYQALIQNADKSIDKRLVKRVNFIIDELGNLPEIPSFTNMITAARSRNVRFYLALQSLSQLDDKYGVKASEIIKENCGLWAYLYSNSHDTVEQISRRCGNTSLVIGTKTLTKRLVTPEQLYSLEKERGECLFLLERNYPFLAYVKDISVTNPELKPVGKLPRMTDEPVPLFDLSKYLWRMDRGLLQIREDPELDKKLPVFEISQEEDNAQTIEIPGFNLEELLKLTEESIKPNEES